MKNTSLFFLVVVVILSFSFETTKDYNSKANQINVVIDAGHASNDYGAAVDGKSEKKIIEELITKIQAFNKNKKNSFSFQQIDRCVYIYGRKNYVYKHN